MSAVQVLVAVLVALPWLGSFTLLAALVMRGDAGVSATAATRFGLAVSVVTLLAAALATAGAQLSMLRVAGASAAVPGVDLDWVPALGIRLQFGLDGISAPLVLLTTLLATLVCLHLVRVHPVAGHVPALVACVLAVLGAALATFLARDLVVFFVAFETVLIPMWFIIARWGDDTQRARSAPPDWVQPGGEAARRDAANRFVLFTVTGSALMLLGILLVAVRAGTTDLARLTAEHGSGLSTREQTVAAALIVLGLAVKAPMFPLHTWLPPAHTIAPTAGSVLLAGVLLKMGTYGLVRIGVGVVPEGMRAVAPLLGTFGVAGIVWAGLACCVERDLKRLIALSSVAHMGFVLLGVATMTTVGIQGALFANIAHGLITGLLFLAVGALKDRHHTAVLAELPRGLRDRLPRLGWILALAAIAGLGLPGLAGFWGELLAILGAWRSDSAIGVLSRPLAVTAVLGTLIAAVYLLRVLRRIWHGSATAPAAIGEPAVGDATGHEVAVMMPLVAATVVLGLLPWLLLNITQASVTALLGVGA